MLPFLRSDLNMAWRRFGCLLAVLVVLSLPSCGGGAKKKAAFKIDKVPVTPIKGVIKVDGNAQRGVQCRLMPQDETKEKWKTRFFTGTTNEDGEFSVSIYQDENGVPAGKYALTFIWPTEVMRRQSRAEIERSDQLHQRYLSVKPDSKKIVVEDGKAVDLGTIELTTK